MAESKEEFTKNPPLSLNLPKDAENWEIWKKTQMRQLSQSNSRSRKKSPVNLKYHRTTRDTGLRTDKHK
jgi:hypothetical protein